MKPDEHCTAHHAPYTTANHHALPPAELEGAIRQRAYDLYGDRVRMERTLNPVADWVQAESELLACQDGCKRR